MLAGTGSIVEPEAKEDKSKQTAHLPHVIRTRELTSRSIRSFPPSATDIIRMPSPSPSITKPNKLGTSSTYFTERLDNSDRYQTSRTHHPASNFLWTTASQTGSQIDFVKPAYPVSNASTLRSKAGSIRSTITNIDCTRLNEVIVFPPLDCSPQYGAANLSPLGFAYQRELLFPTNDFNAIWESDPIDITDCLLLIPSDTLTPQNYVQMETKFASIPWRLTLDRTLVEGMPRIQRGTVINYKESNHGQGKYIVECCQLVQDGIAYVKVVFRDHNQRVYPPYDPYRPMFILAIPEALHSTPFPGNIPSPTLIMPTGYINKYGVDYTEVVEPDTGFAIWRLQRWMASIWSHCF